MEKRQENAKTSIEGIKKLMDDNRSITAEVPALDEEVTLFETDLANLEAVEEKFSVATKGKTSTKHELEDILIATLYPLICSVRAFARSAKDMELFEIVDVRISDLIRMRDTELVEFSNIFIKKAGENLADLGKYKITVDDLTDLQQKIDAYDSAIGAQGGGMALRTTSHDDLKACFVKVEEDLVQIDDLIELVKGDHPEFYDQYFAERPVKALGIRHRKPSNPPQAAVPTK